MVILQFCSNDPSDNILGRVTELENGRFVFRKAGSTNSWVKKHLSNSILQRSQLYNFFRNVIYEYAHKRQLAGTRKAMQKDATEKTGVRGSPEEVFYNSLLDAFAKDLKARGIRLIMISVNGEMDQFPSITRKVKELHGSHTLEYIDIVPWFGRSDEGGTAEGHRWGAREHKLLGDNLSLVVRRAQ